MAMARFLVASRIGRAGHEHRSKRKTFRKIFSPGPVIGIARPPLAA
jgi:hypothetical protein